MDRRLVPAAAAAWASAALLVGQAPHRVLLVAVAAVVVVGACATRWRAVAVVAVALAAVSTSIAWRLGDVTSSPVTQLADNHARAELVVQIVRDARSYRSVGAPGAVARVIVLRAEDRHGRVHLVRDRATAFLTGEHRDLVVGRIVGVTGRLEPSDDSREAAVIRVSDRTPVLDSAWWWSASQRVRTGVHASVAHADAAPAALVPALVAGDDGDLPAQVDHDFRRTGLTHLLAVSGTNLTIVLAMILAIAKACRAPPRVLLVVGLVGVVGFVLLARPEPSVVRAAGMGVVGLAALGTGTVGGVRVLAVAVVALLFLDPWLSREVGFVLSVCATGGILLLAPPFARRLQRWLPRWAAVAIAVPLAAQAACTPAIAAISAEVSLVAVFANVAAAPAVAPATVLGLVAGLVDLLHGPSAAVIGTGAAFSAQWIVLVGHAAASVPGASISWSLPWWLLLVVVPLTLVALWRLAAHPAVVVGLCLGLLAAMLHPPQPGWPPVGWVMVACDVGQGDATVLRVGEGEAVVVDTGLEVGPVDRCLRSLRIRRVRALVLTHADADHIGGAAGAVSGRGVDVALAGRPLPDQTTAALAGVPVRQVARGDRFSVGDLTADVLWPHPARPTRNDELDRNGDSIVLRALVRGVEILLTGDVGERDQDRIARAGSALDADVLKVAHHGSADTSQSFVEAVGARVATISVGADNTYGHPAPSALTGLRRAGSTVHRTDLEGDIAVVVRDGRLAVVTRR